MGEPKGTLRATGSVIAASLPELGDLELRCEGAPVLLFTENESNAPA
jgi:hypothetical protein